MIPDLVVRCDTVKPVAHLSKVRNIHSCDTLLQQGHQNPVVAVQRPDGSQPQPLQMAAVDIVVPAFASDAAKLHIAAPVRKNIPTLQTSPPRFVFQVLHRLSFIGRPACHGKYVQRLERVNFTATNL